MAVNTMESCNKIPPKSACSTNSAKSNDLNRYPIVIPNCSADCNIATLRSKKIQNCLDPASPYLKSDKVQMVSQITDKRVVHRKATDFASSFPLAVKLYKASSDEFKLLKKASKKARKSVLTLPNKTACITQACTVSDMNDSEYYNRETENRKMKSKKRLPIANKRKTSRLKDYEFYNRDAKYCSRLNINLDCSSTDMIQHFNGDGQHCPFSNPRGKDLQPNDVWTVLRNINRFQFRPSPPLSEDSIVIPKKKWGAKKRNNRKDARFIETSHTEEFAYISSFEVGSKSPNLISQSSSCDRITVIDNREEYCNIFKEVENKTHNGKNFIRIENNPRCKNQIKVKNKRFPRSRKGKSKENVPIAMQNRLDEGKHFENIFRNKSESSDNNSNCTTVALNSLSTANTITTSIISNPAKEDFTLTGISAETSLFKNNDISSTINEPVNLFHISSDESAQQLKGITRVVLSKGQNITLAKRMEVEKRKNPQLGKATKTVPITSETEIKRKLDGPKLLENVSDKRQLSSSILVNNYEPPQFDGLDKHIWPFMIEWYKNDREKQISNGLSTIKESYSKSKNKMTRTVHNVPKIINKIPMSKQLTKKGKNDVLNLSATNNTKKGESHHEKIHQQNKIQTPICQFKDKMLQFLYKKKSSQSVIASRQIGVQTCADYKICESVNKVDKYTDTFSIKGIANPHGSFRKAATQSCRKPHEVSYHAWSKVKWASDFIDNVMKKIRNGVYYINEIKGGDGAIISHFKEASIQAVLTTKNSFTSYEEESLNYELDGLKTIDVIDPLGVLGFDASVPELEIQTFDQKKISIKHCLTNITLQFDVTVPEETSEVARKLQYSPSLMPVDGVNGWTKLVKYEATIFNATLPAELCGIIPKMIRNMYTMQTEETLPHELFNLTESSRNENPSSLQSLSLSQIGLCPEIRRFLSGTFTKLSNKLKELTFKVKPIGNTEYGLNIVLLLPDLKKTMVSQLTVMPRISLSIDKSQSELETGLETKPLKNRITPTQTISTRALIPYCASKHQPIEMSKLYEFNVIDVIHNYYKYKTGMSLKSGFNFPNCNYGTCNNSINVTFNLNDNGVKNQVNVTITNLKLDSLYDNLSKSNISNGIDTSVAKSIKYFENLSDKVEEGKSRKHVSSNCRLRKKSFVKLYKKCKSATTMIDLNCTRSLDKMLTIEDFFQLIGTKTLATVFDRHATKKILSSLIEMRKWVSDINSTQALLVLLLANKKDTPNLVQFRHLVLQGIAVNRITRANELDMEIEVIEKENMNMFSKYEGISYLPASTENQDSLLEELYWIAKTTASDYQRTFDETSEILLQSLLERRRKLNPSYLRVMARYVGLGLLKSRVTR